MVDYPDLSNLNSTSGIAGLLSLPSSSYPYFWAWIIAGLWLIITMTLYFTEKTKTGRGKILSSMAVSAFAIIFLSTFGTILGIISSEIMIYLLVFGTVIIGIWFFSK
jgi:hypothetical protein